MHVKEEREEEEVMDITTSLRISLEITVLVKFKFIRIK